MIVAIDPGHGGKSTGVVAGNDWDRLVEKDWVLELGFVLTNRLIHMGVDARLTRDDDRDLGLTEAARIASGFGADLALCLHVNSFVNTSKHGLLAFHMPGKWRAAEVASAVANHAPKFLRERNARPRSANPSWQNVRNVLAPFEERQINACLIEFGFASNNADRAYLLTEHGKHGCANAAEAGAIEYMGLLHGESLHSP